ncbi:A-kinase anchor protein 7 [Strigomonas culicis]|nr:A-kinase anchor protein 7 [Strigomonas culicis]|eukprot:EPY28609.1 A-kinase anchor protein 7 [Strigomonas culicis]
MHNAFLFANQSVEPLLIPVQRLHITLGVFSLPETQLEERLAQIAACVQAATREACRTPLQLRFRGLGTFGHGRVLFVKCASEGHYTTLDHFVRLVRQRVGLGLGVDMKGNPHDSYVPHVTVAKVRPSQKNILGPRLPLSVWADFQHHDFGDVTFNEVQVCSMKGKGENGYYKVISTASIQ